MPRVFSVSGVILGLCLALGAGGCAGGSVEQDAAPHQDDAAVPDDAAAQDDAALDAPVQSDAAAQDAPRDTAVQQDVLRDTAVQQDAQHDTGPPPCTNDDMCNPDGGVGGRYCFTNKGICYTPGTCSSTPECTNGATCNLSLVPPGYFCTCAPLTFPPILCRAQEQCVPVLNLCQPL